MILKAILGYEDLEPESILHYVELYAALKEWLLVRALSSALSELIRCDEDRKDVMSLLSWVEELIRIDIDTHAITEGYLSLVRFEAELIKKSRMKVETAKPTSGAPKNGSNLSSNS